MLAPGRAPPACPGRPNACVRHSRDGGVTAGGVALGAQERKAPRKERIGCDATSGWPWPCSASALALAACGGSPDGDRVASLSGDDATGTTTGAAKDPEQGPPAGGPRLRQVHARARRGHARPGGRRAGPDPGAGRRRRPRRRRPARPQEVRGGPEGLRRPDGRRRRRPPARPGGPRRHGRLRQVHARARHRHARPDRRRPGACAGTATSGPDPDSEKFQQAEQACDHHLANLGRGRRESGGRS